MSQGLCRHEFASGADRIAWERLFPRDIDRAVASAIAIIQLDDRPFRMLPKVIRRADQILPVRHETIEGVTGEAHIRVDEEDVREGIVERDLTQVIAIIRSERPIPFDDRKIMRCLTDDRNDRHHGLRFD